MLTVKRTVQCARSHYESYSSCLVLYYAGRCVRSHYESLLGCLDFHSAQGNAPTTRTGLLKFLCSTAQGNMDFLTRADVEANQATINPDIDTVSTTQ